MARKPEPCEFCGKMRGHTAGCPAPYVARMVKVLSVVPTRVLGLAVERLSPRHRERLRAALPDGYWLERVRPFELTPPADCPYVSEAAGDRCFVVVIGFDPNGVYEPGA